MANVLALFGDSSSAIRYFSRNFGRSFLGWHSHLINLGVKYLMELRKMLVEKIQALLKKLSHSIPTEILPSLTPLNFKERNESRWSSTFEILGRYCDLMPFLSQMYHDAVSELLLKACEDGDAEFFWIVFLICSRSQLSCNQMLLYFWCSYFVWWFKKEVRWAFNAVGPSCEYYGESKFCTSDC